ncbi:MAG: methyltransferase domain-containing protein [Alphaproteobacteria bacterium]|nr:methyltransferase domain-containing protein [Alphaproteobacteria bacterium]
MRRVLRRMLGRIASSNLAQAERYFAVRQWQDALLRFTVASAVAPKSEAAWLGLARTYLSMERPKGALRALRRLREMGYATHDEVVYLTALAEKNGAPETMPLALVKRYFDAAAPEFDRDRIAVNDYQGYRVLAERVRPLLAAGRSDHAVLDLGVGTGQCGSLLRDVAATLTGVDVAPSMLEEAARRKMYDRLVEAEVVAYMQATDGRYDVVLAAGVASYIGDLSGFYRGAARVLKPGGLLAFSADMLESDEGYAFDMQDHWFRFSRAYLQKLAADNGFSEKLITQAPTYPAYNAWFCVFQKS